MMSSFKVIGRSVPEKSVSKCFSLPYMGMAAILVMCTRHYEQTFVPPPHGGSTCNLVSIGPPVSEMSFENVGGADTDDGPLSIL